MIFAVGNIHGGGEELVELIIHEKFIRETNQVLQLY
jgi:hypothetical protein